MYSQLAASRFRICSAVPRSAELTPRVAQAFHRIPSSLSRQPSHIRDSKALSWDTLMGGGCVSEVTGALEALRHAAAGPLNGSFDGSVLPRRLSLLKRVVTSMPVKGDACHR